MCPAYYEINVSLNGRHFFATHERSLTSVWKMEKALEVFKQKFPASEGYAITVTAEFVHGKMIYDSTGRWAPDDSL